MHGPDYLLRDYHPEDFNLIWELDQICFTQGIAYSKEELAYFLKQKRSFAAVAETSGRLAGLIIVEYDLKRTGRVITIDVHPDSRRLGLGSRLMGSAEAKLAGLNCNRVVLEVAVDNNPAISFYKRRGYSVVKTIPRYYLGSLDALRMEKIISSFPAP